MKFSRLRLVGFKSFVDPSEVLIETGLTGVVGPNGCGKSNLLEALRWVMGESSHKSMRASGMDDVIFSGSRGRPARNSAEVMLVVDNADRTAPAIFNDSETLEVSRRIEREAGSVYRVNGKEVRARDVQLLFADASSGAHSPALVRQGQIGELISAKPRDRRRILEEAAGIAGLHSRRHEAELRLRAAETNLARLDDVIAQLETQLDSLRRQARQATRYRTVSAEIRKSEALLLHLKWAGATEAVAEREAALREVISELGRVTQLAATASKLQAGRAEAMPALRDAEVKAGAVLRHLMVNRDSLDQEKERVVSRQAELAGRLEQVERDMAREAELIGSTDETLSRLDAEEKEIASELEGADTRRNQAGAKLEDAETTLRDLEVRLEEANRAAAEQEARRNQFERIIRDESERLMRLEGQIADVNRESEALGGEAVDDTIAQLAARVAELKTALADAENLQVEREAALADLRQTAEAARQPVIEAERDLKSLETERATLARVLALDTETLWPKLIDAVHVEPGYETALGAAIGDDLEHPADEGSSIHWRAIAAGNDDPALPAGARPLSELVRGPDLLKRRLAQIGVVEAEDGARLQAELKPGQRLVTAAGDLWRWDGLAAAADAPTASAQRLAQRNRLADLEREIAKLVEAFDSHSAALEEARTAVGDEEARFNEARALVREARKAHGDAADRLAAAERSAGKATARLSALAEARLRLEHSVEESRQAKEEATRGLEALAGEASLQGPIETLKGEVATARSGFATARAAAETLDRELAMRRARLEGIEAERQRWRRNTAEAGAQIKRLDERKTAASEEMASLADAPGELEKRRARIATDIDKAEADRKAAADALAVGETALAEADKAVRQADATVSLARETRAREEATLEGQRQRLTDIEALIGETLECRPQEALGLAGVEEGVSLPSADKLETDLDRLKRDRDRLGSVNLRAEEEMREVEAQHDGLVTERSDLEAAIARLREGISDLNREGRQRLLKAFDVVNEHFKRLFVELFGGGQAELKLTESDDPLEAGLEILARPPGKRPTTLTLLSGGEQALTATALIFAVFLTNPAPVCVLDEVDAPLDDANVERFCNMMDEMARQTDTRFMIITHNPITMARMDRLFGVTMAERGVSQLVSVDIGGALRLREAG